MGSKSHPNKDTQQHSNGLDRSSIELKNSTISFMQPEEEPDFIRSNSLSSPTAYSATFSPSFNGLAQPLSYGAFQEALIQQQNQLYATQLIAAPTHYPLVHEPVRFQGPAFNPNPEHYWQRKYYVLTPSTHAYHPAIQSFKPNSDGIDFPEATAPSQLTLCYQVPTILPPSFDRVASPASNGKEFSSDANTLISFTDSPLRASTVASSGTHSPVNRLHPSPLSLQVDQHLKDTLGVNPRGRMREDHLNRARFFVIKSRWAENVRQAIKHEVWCSTTNGNAVLDAAFKDMHRKPEIAQNSGTVEEDVNLKGEVEISFEEVRKSCSRKNDQADGHVYLFFSVNGSRQFCGIAEMIGPVEKNRPACIWQDSFKFKDSFPIRWLYIKDVENTLCNHLILPEHDNRPITFLRDAAEIVSRAKAIELFRIFHNHP